MALQQLPKPTLSRREREVAALVAEGLTNKEIGQRLFVSERTVDAHLEHVREKLGVNSRAQVAAWFVAQSQPAAEAMSPPVPIRRPRVSRLAVVAAAATIAVLLLGGLVVWTRDQTPVLPSGPIITTVVGSTGGNSVLGGYTGDNGPATSALLARPWSVAVSPLGYLYVADEDRQVIRRVDPHGVITTLAGGVTNPFVDGGAGPTTGIGFVTSVAISPDGEVYFANQRLVGRIDAGDSVHLVPTSPVHYPTSLCFAPDGTLYISDTFDDWVWKRAPDGTLSVYAGQGTPGFTGDGGAATGADLRYPVGLALDSGGNLYIADAGNNRIRRVDARSHVISTIAGRSGTYGFGGDGGPASDALLSLPHGVAVAPDGDVYIADTGNDRVRRVDAKTHVITTVAGTGMPAYGGDGVPAGRAAVFGPFGVSVDRRGDLYIADTGNHRIRMVQVAAGA